MAQQVINIGAAPNDGTGDALRVALDKVNTNFAELYGAGAASSVQPGRLVSTGTGLTGGGSLAEDRTISLSSDTLESLDRADAAVQPDDLATVATSGDYSDLLGLPSLGSAATADMSDFATAAQGALADSALQAGDIQIYNTVGQLLASTMEMSVGTYVVAADYRYEVVASDPDLTTAGGVMLRVLPVDGVVSAEAFADTVTASSFMAAYTAARILAVAERLSLAHRPLTFRCVSAINVSNGLALDDGAGSHIRGLNLDLSQARFQGVVGGDLSATTPVVTIRNRGSDIRLPLIDGGRAGSCLLVAGCADARFWGGWMVHPISGGYGIKYTGSMGNMIHYSPFAQELDPTDTEFATEGNFGASACLIDTADFQIFSPNFCWAKYPLDYTSNASLTTIISPHIWNDSGSDSWQRVDTVNVRSQSTKQNMIYGAYLDNGYVLDFGGCLTITGEQLILTSRVTLTDPTIRVYPQASQSGGSPNFSHIEVRHASVGYLANPNDGTAWDGNYTALSNNYSRMRSRRGHNETMREKTEVYIDASTSGVRKTVITPSGSHITSYEMGAYDTPIVERRMYTSGGIPYTTLDTSILRVRSPKNGVSEIYFGDEPTGIRHSTARTGVLSIRNTLTVNFQNLPTYATNAAAVTGGLIAGDAYKTSTGEMRVVV